MGASLINSSILYAAPLWGATTSTNVDKIQSAQIRAARFITNKSWQRSKKKKHRQQLLNELSWPNTRQIINSAILNLAKKAISTNSSFGLNNIFKTIKPTSNRGGPTVRIEHKSKINKKSDIFSVIAPALFNGLPAKMRNPLTIDKQFKILVKKHSCTVNLLPEH